MHLHVAVASFSSSPKLAHHEKVLRNNNQCAILVCVKIIRMFACLSVEQNHCSTSGVEELSSQWRNLVAGIVPPCPAFAEGYSNTCCSYKFPIGTCKNDLHPAHVRRHEIGQDLLRRLIHFKSPNSNADLVTNMPMYIITLQLGPASSDEADRIEFLMLLGAADSNANIGAFYACESDDDELQAGSFFYLISCLLLYIYIYSCRRAQ